MNEVLMMASLVVAGAVSMLAGALDWEVLVAVPKSDWIERVLGRDGARAFYVMLGFALIGAGAAFANHVIPLLPSG